MGVGGGAQPSAIFGSCFVLMATEESDGSPVGGAANSPAPDDGAGSAGLAGSQVLSENQTLAHCVQANGRLDRMTGSSTNHLSPCPAFGVCVDGHTMFV